MDNNIDNGAKALVDYWQSIDSMPQKFQDIHRELWDYTGRPNFEYSYPMALGRLMDMSNDWDEFIANFIILFPEIDASDFKIKNDLTTNWMCYIYGIQRVGK